MIFFCWVINFYYLCFCKLSVIHLCSMWFIFFSKHLWKTFLFYSKEGIKQCIDSLYKHSLSVCKKNLCDENIYSTILQHIGEILALFSEHESQKLADPQDSFTPAVIALIVICVLMFLGTIVLIIYIHNTTKR